MKNDDKQQFEQEVKRKVQVSPTLPVNGCLWVIILAALACMSVKGCKMVNMKYEEAKVKHEMVMDSLNKVKADTVYYKGK
jgi:hypothetical protein